MLTIHKAKMSMLVLVLTINHPIIVSNFDPDPYLRICNKEMATEMDIEMVRITANILGKEENYLFGRAVSELQLAGL